MGLGGVELQGTKSKMFRNQMLSPKEIAAHKLNQRKKKIIQQRNQISETLNADDITLQQAQTPVADEKRNNQFTTALEKPGHPTVVNRTTLRAGECPASQYPTVGLELGMHSVDSIGGRMYASDGSRSRLGQSPALSQKELKTYSPEVDQHVSGDQSHVMAPKQSLF